MHTQTETDFMFHSMYFILYHSIQRESYIDIDMLHIHNIHIHLHIHIHKHNHIHT